MSKLSHRHGVLSASLILLFSAWHAPANAYVIETCDTDIPSYARSCSAGDVTQGWDGAGLGSFSFDYFIDNGSVGGLPTGGGLGLTAAAIVTAVETAFQAAAATWAAVIDVTFNQISTFLAGEIDFYFHGVGWGDGGFDGAINPSLLLLPTDKNVFAHTWGPTDVSVSTTDSPGNMHFDVDELWVTSGAPAFNSPSSATSLLIDLQTVMLHELGHVLGLGHEDGEGTGLGGSVMQTLYVGELRNLTADDIAGARALYACVGEGCSIPPCTGAQCPCTGADCPPDDDPTAVPEPGTLALVAIGLLGLGLSRRKPRHLDLS